MSDRNICVLIKDLSALYAEGRVSADTKELIGSHLKVCSQCSADYEAKREEESREAEKEAEARRYLNIAKKIKYRRMRTAGIAVAVVCILFLVYVFMFQLIKVDGTCMSPVINDGKWYVIDKAKYKVKNPQQNDIVIYKLGEICYVTRIVETAETHAGLLSDEYLVEADNSVIDEPSRINRSDIIGQVIR